MNARLSSNGADFPLEFIRSGQVYSALNDTSCQHAVKVHMPGPIALDETSDKGLHGDLCPPCCSQNLSGLGHWDGGRHGAFRHDLKPLRLFKCRMGFWIVVSGLYDDHPQEIWNVGERTGTS